MKDFTNEVLYILKWPFSQVLCIKGTGTLRNDRTVYQASDQNSLSQPDVYKTWVSLKAELTFDNTINKGLNLYYGTRWKLFAEVYRQVNANNKQMYVVGLGLQALSED